MPNEANRHYATPHRMLGSRAAKGGVHPYFIAMRMELFPGGGSARDIASLLCALLRAHRSRIEAAFEAAVIKLRRDFSLLNTGIKNVSRQFGQASVKSDSRTESYEASAIGT